LTYPTEPHVAGHPLGPESFIPNAELPMSTENPIEQQHLMPPDNLADTRPPSASLFLPTLVGLFFGILLLGAGIGGVIWGYERRIAADKSPAELKVDDSAASGERKGPVGAGGGGGG